MSALLFSTIEISVNVILMSNSKSGAHKGDYSPYLQYKRQGLLLFDHYVAIRNCMLVSSYELKQNMAVERGVIESVLSTYIC
jgi:hypothetical protein